jgi:hypothetical protein
MAGAAASPGVCGSIRVRVEIMGPGKYKNVGKSQSVVIMINPIIFTRTRRYLGRAQPGGELLEVAPQPGRGHHLHPGATTVSLASLRRATAAALAITAGRRRRRRRRPCLVSGGRSLAAGCVQRRGTPPSRLRRRGRLLVRARRRLGPPTTRASTRDDGVPLQRSEKALGEGWWYRAHGGGGPRRANHARTSAAEPRSRAVAACSAAAARAVASPSPSAAAALGSAAEPGACAPTEAMACASSSERR